jgi:FKBP-type peptidyl-prolyl cis-trans isomerase FklB
MKQINYLFAFAIFTLCFAACNDDDKSDEEWRNKNLAQYAEIVAADDWSPVPIFEGSPEGVYYQELAKGDGTQKPIQTSKVQVKYKGYFFNDDKQLFDAGGTAEFEVAGVVRGFGVALQAMHIGDKWKICIPYNLGYGYAGNTSIKGYSTLFFEVELSKIIRY